jgi:hypothetical protein
MRGALSDMGGLLNVDVLATAGGSRDPAMTAEGGDLDVVIEKDAGWEESDLAMLLAPLNRSVPWSTSGRGGRGSLRAGAFGFEGGACAGRGEE